MRIGEQLRIIRRGVGLTQEEVAEMLCVTRQALSNWEQEKAIPDLYTFARLAAVYQFSPDEFLLGKSNFKGTQKMKTNLSESQIEKLIKKHYPDMVDLNPMSGGLVSQTYSFSSREAKYVFQIGGKLCDFEKQQYISKRYRNAFPVREVLSIHEAGDGLVYCFSSFIEGRKLFDLSDRERRDLSAPIIEALKLIAKAEVPADGGYGRFDASGHAPYESWIDFISVIYNDSVCDWSALSLKGYSDVVVRKAIDELKSNISSIQLEKPCLVHGDVGSFNIIAMDGRVSGFIDCGLALYGDPLYDIANLLFWNEDKLQDLITEVKREYISDDNSTRIIIYSYILRIGLEEIYNTVILSEIGYDINWVIKRLDTILKTGI